MGHAVTAPVVGQYIGIWLWGSDTSLATRAIDTLDGATSAESLAHAGVLNALGRGAAMPAYLATAALTYWAKPFSVAHMFGGTLPQFVGLYAAHNHAGALGAANNNLFAFQGVTYTTG